MARKPSRRDVLKGSGALALAVYAVPLRAAAPPPTAITPELIAAAQKEGKVIYYTSVDLPLAEKVAKSFEAKFPGVAVRVERSGAERIFQRISQEYASRIYAVDAINSSDAAHFIVWKRDGMLAPFVPEDVAKHYPAEHRDPDGMFASFRIGLSGIGYNTNLVKPEEAPKSFADLLEPKWAGKIVKAHPAYSGTILTGMHVLLDVLGWDHFEKLGKQRVMQIQSSTEPPKKLAQGERAVMADGNEYNLIQLKESGAPLEPIYAPEGTPVIIGNAAILKNAPNPNAAKLFYAWIFSKEAQQLMSDATAVRSLHAEVMEKEGRKPLKEIKLLYSDPAKLEPMIEDIKKRYEQYFGV